MSARYAIYFAPEPGEALARFGAAWLGRDCGTGTETELAPIPGVSPGRLRAITEAPRHYGFQATLKAPFALADGVDEAMLRDDFDAFAREHAAFSTPALRLGVLSGFVALLLSEPSEAMQALAAGCVDRLDRFRRPPNEAELARRRAQGLSPRQEALLRRWGYPYVMEAFRFHMTLTQRLEEDERQRVLAGLKERIAPHLGEPPVIASLALFQQSSRAAARSLLEQAAARKWGVQADQVYAKDHRVFHSGSGKSIDYGALVEEAATLKPTAGAAKLKHPSEWRYIGKDMPVIDNFDSTTGGAVYGADVSVPGMKIAVVARAPAYRGKAKSFDASEALKVQGVEQVVEIPPLPDDKPAEFRALGGIAVIGSNTWSVMQGRRS